MKAQYFVEFSDYKAAQALHTQRHRRTLVSLWLVSLGFPLLGIWFAYVIIARRPEGVSPWNASGLYSTLLLVAVGLFLPILRQYGFRKQFQQMFPAGKMPRECYLMADDDQLISGVTGAGESRFLWPSLYKLERNNSTMLIYISQKQFLFIPLRKVEQSDRDELIQLAERKISIK